jgi:hypothetical protein
MRNERQHAVTLSMRHTMDHCPLWISNFTTPSSRIFNSRAWQASSLTMLARFFISKALSGFSRSALRICSRSFSMPDSKHGVANRASESPFEKPVSRAVPRLLAAWLPMFHCPAGFRDLSHISGLRIGLVSRPTEGETSHAQIHSDRSHGADVRNRSGGPVAQPDAGIERRAGRRRSAQGGRTPQATETPKATETKPTEAPQFVERPPMVDTTTTAEQPKPADAAKPVAAQSPKAAKPKHKRYLSEARIIGELHRHGVYW